MACALESARLPPEIIRQIVSLVSEDRDRSRQTLLACTLVCQDWLFDSRAFLFRNIRIYSQKTLRSFFSNILHSERDHPWLASIHHISLGFLESAMEETSIIVEISEHLYTLRSMEWEGFTPQSASLRTALFPALGQFTCLYQLKLVVCTFPSFGDLKNVLVALPYLSYLTMGAVNWTDSVNGSISSSLASPQIRPRLSHLSVFQLYRRAQADAVFHWLSTTPTRSMLRDLYLDLSGAMTALQMIGHASLAALTVRLEGVRQLLGDDSLVGQLSQLLSRVDDVELLRLHAMFESIHGVHSWAEVARTLRLFASTSSIRRLRLSYSSRSYVPYDGERLYKFLERLDPMLENNAFRSLEAVEFALFVFDGKDALEGKHSQTSGWLQRKLPKLHRRVAVELYVYNSRCAFGPAGFSEDILQEHDFHRNVVMDVPSLKAPS